MDEETTVPALIGRGGMRHVLRVAFPLVMATSGHALRLFADRVMLSHYGPDTIAASMPAGLTCFTFMSLFIGTAGYTNTFVAQYTGAGERKRVGLAVWQGLWVALFGGVVVALTGCLARPIFSWMGHAPIVQAEQVRYFQILTKLSWAGIALGTLNSFWSGRGKTRVVMVIELSCALLNVVLNYIMIFGKCGCPRLGIVGAGLATGLSTVVGLVVALVLFLRPENRREFGTLPHCLIDFALLRRLLRFGFPNGFQFILDLVAFNLFIVFIGRIGQQVLEAANIAFALNALAFLPIIGVGMTASILVGQGIGARDIGFARRSVKSALIVALAYSVGVGLFFVFSPHTILSLFARSGDAGQAETLRLAAVSLRFIMAYLLFDTLYIIYSHAVKGAGDTRFAMIAGITLSWTTLVLPCFLIMRYRPDVWAMWSVLVLHVVIAGVVFAARYRAGKWQSMRVI